MAAKHGPQPAATTQKPGSRRRRKREHNSDLECAGNAGLVDVKGTILRRCWQGVKMDMSS